MNISPTTPCSTDDHGSVQPEQATPDVQTHPTDRTATGALSQLPGWASGQRPRSGSYVLKNPSDAIPRPRSNSTSNNTQLSPEFQEKMRDDYLNHRWRHDRSVADGPLFLKKHAAMRREEISSIPGAERSADQYGFRLTYHPKLETGLALDHSRSAEYHRFKPHKEFSYDCMDLYERAGHSAASSYIAFANSLHVIQLVKELMGNLLSDFVDSIRDDNIKIIDDKLIAIEFSGHAARSRSQRMAWAINSVGGTPSASHVSRLLNPDTEMSTVLHEDIDNLKKLDEIFSINGIRNIVEIVPQDHPLSALAGYASALCYGLQVELQQQLAISKFKHAPVITNCLNALSSTAYAMPTLIGDTGLFISAHQTLISEIYTILGKCKPYDENSFRTEALERLKFLAGPVFERLKIKDPVPLLFSSGMHAISAGLFAAQHSMPESQRSSISEQRVDYFEAMPFFSADLLRGPGHVYSAPLNVSLPLKRNPEDNSNDWEASKLVESLKQRLGPSVGSSVFVLDVALYTRQVDSGKTDLAEVLEGLESRINDRSLKVLICETHQKYQSSTRVMAGSVTLLGADDEQSAAIEKELSAMAQQTGWMQNDDSQLSTHVLKYGTEHSFKLSERAAANAAFVQAACFSEPGAKRIGFDGYQEKLPFGVIHDAHKQAMFVSDGPERQELNLMEVAAITLPQIMSFGFPQTTYSAINNSTFRLSFGQEPQHELVEKLYALGWLARHRFDSVTIDQILDHIIEIGRAALDVKGNEAGDPLNDGNGMLMARVRPAALSNAAGDPLSGMLAIARTTQRSATTVMDQSESIATFRARLTQRSEAIDLVEGASHLNRGTEAELAINKVVSMLRLLSFAYGAYGVSTKEELQKITDVFDKVLNAGLPGVSPGTRSTIVSEWWRLHTLALRSGTENEWRAVVPNLIRYARRLVSAREEKARYFRSMPDAAISACNALTQAQLADALFRPLDVDARCSFIEELIGWGALVKATLCLDAFKLDLDDAARGSKRLPRPERIRGHEPSSWRALEDISPDELDQLRHRLEKFSAEVVAKKASEPVES